MGQFLGDFAVVGEHQHTGGVLVQPSDREYPVMAVLEQVHHCPLGVRVAGGGDIALRLVHHDVHLLLALEGLAVELDFVLEHVDLGSEFGHDLTVHGHHARLYHLVSLAA